MDRLDVYVPKTEEGAGAAPRPVVVFVHGGVWASGDKWQFSPLGSFLAEQGVISVLVQYTLYPKVQNHSLPLRTLYLFLSSTGCRIFKFEATQETKYELSVPFTSLIKNGLSPNFYLLFLSVLILLC